MKNQYFGDINDYRKYGILRCLATVGPLRLGICWMLTPSDGSTDGQQTSYLASPSEWRPLDPVLFDALLEAVERGQRDVSVAKASNLLPAAVFFSEEVPTGNASRAGYLSACLDTLAETDVVFFDPDNGLEVRSAPFGAKASPKYLYWRELVAAYQEGHSLLIYQHHPHEVRAEFHKRIAREFTRRVSPRALWALATSSVVYFLAAQPGHLAEIRDSVEAIQSRWGREVEVIDLLDA